MSIFNYHRYIVFLGIAFLLACKSQNSEDKEDPQTTTVMEEEITISNEFDIQGHRGARGLLPENSLPGFERAMSLGVNTLELDVVISKDKQVVVSHEPWISAEICLSESGDIIDKEDQMSLNMYQMDYEQIRKFNCGSLMHERFIDQGKIQTYKPRLEEVFRFVSKHREENALPQPGFNIEIKSHPDGDGMYHPEPDEFSDLVFSVIDQSIGWEFVNIQSFDPRVLKYFHENYPKVKLAYLEEDTKDWESLIEDLGFTPDIYSCYYQLLDESTVSDIQEGGMKVIPWTVNQSQDMLRLAKWGVDGIITDYPNIALEILKRKE